MTDTTIKVSEEVRDRLRAVAEERGISPRSLVESLAAELLTDAERAENTAFGIVCVRAQLRPDLTSEGMERAERWHQDIAAGRVGEVR